MKRIAILSLGLLAAACSRTHPTGTSESSSSAAAAPSPADVAEAENIFKTRCTPCHGPNGRGDGPASASLNPHPRNFTDKTWQSSVNDEHIQKIVQYGGAAVGKSPNMPANPDLQSKPNVVSALAKKVRSFGQ